MIEPTANTIPSGGTPTATACPECGAVANGNFCSSCGADLSEDSSGVFGVVSSTVRQSFLATYVRILRSPIKAPVALAEDPSYRQQLSFFVSGLALFGLLIVPILIRAATPTDVTAQYSESMQMLLSVLSQVGLYVGAIVTFLLGFVLFHYFAKEPRSFKAYLKLYCLTFGFILPLYAVYEYVARGLLGGTGMSSFSTGTTTQDQVFTASYMVSIVLTLVLWAYFVAIHRRFWRMPLWKAGVLYTATAFSSHQLSYWGMFFVGYWVAYGLISIGVVTV